VNILNKQPRTNDIRVVIQLGGWAWGEQPFPVKINLLGKLLKSPGPGWILRINDPSYGI
jgi:hypothetical protein